MVAATFLSAFVIFLPIYSIEFSGDFLSWIKTILLSIHNTIRLFIVDGEFDIVKDSIDKSMGWVYTAYTILAAVVYVIAPILTFSVVLSMFKSLSAYRRFFMSFNRDIYIFSELNEKSILLAEDLKAHDKKRVVVFADYFEDGGEAGYELDRRAKSVGAICFKNDIRLINCRSHRQSKPLYFCVIGKNETENIEQALSLIKKYRNTENTHLMLFSENADSSLILTNLDKGRMKVRRINEASSLIYRNLYENGHVLFDTAREQEDGTKLISAVVIGLGRYGNVMARSLTWYTQMLGYRLKLDLFDQDEMAYDRFYTQCPELMSPEYNGVFIEGEAQYEIKVHAKISLESIEFAREIGRIRPTFVFAALGSDARNVEAAAYVRMLCERNGIKPVIQAIVHNSQEKEALNGIKNFKGQPYDIDFIGDLRDSYCEKVVLNSDVEAEALKEHLQYNDEESFWLQEYNYNSSIALAIALKARKDCHVPGADKPKEERTAEEQDILQSAEHCRWNTYMRSEGYVYSGSPDSSSRNDLAKMHHNLVNYSELTEADKLKDNR